MSEDSLRASDADREATVARLQSAFAEGRLDLSEVDDRTTAAYAAKTLGELARLTSDLPPPGASPVPAPRPQSPAPEQQHQQHSDMWRWMQYGLPPVIAINFVIWLAIGLTDHWVHPWWIWIIVAWVCGAFGGPGGRRRRHIIDRHDRHREIDRRHDRRRLDLFSDDSDSDDDDEKDPPRR